MDAEQVMVFRVVRASGAITEVDAVFSEGKWYARKGWPRVSADTPREAIVAYCHHNEIDVEEIRLPGQETGVEMAARMIGEAVAHVTATLTRERDAAVDAVRADYAPRALPPTVDEVQAVSRLWGRDHAVRCVMWRSDEHGRWTESWNTGGYTGMSPPTDASFMLFGPDGPVAWSELARLVAQGGV